MAAIVDGFLKYGNEWETIAKSYDFGTRTPKSLQDKFYLMRKNEPKTIMKILEFNHQNLTRIHFRQVVCWAKTLEKCEEWYEEYKKNAAENRQMTTKKWQDLYL
jgi:hypothetical protein